MLQVGGLQQDPLSLLGKRAHHIVFDLLAAPRALTETPVSRIILRVENMISQGH